MARRKDLKIVKLVMIAVLLAGVGLTVYGGEVLKPGGFGMMDGRGTIIARKGLMRAISANFGDLRGKAGAGNIKGIEVNAKSIAAIAAVLPVMFSETHDGDYTANDGVKFKGGNKDDLAAAAQNLMNEAEVMAKLSKDEASVDAINAQVGKMGGACGACHSGFRAKIE